MIKKLTCIECPKGCPLAVDIENCKVVKVTGHECPKGEKYAKTEIENPMRILTAAVLAEGLPIKMVPVRTDKPIPKSRLMEAMNAIKRMKLTRPVGVGEVIAENFLGTGANLVSTRRIEMIV
jgi:CxxC motif-containing protein